MNSNKAHPQTESGHTQIKGAFKSSTMQQTLQGLFDQSHSPLQTYISNFTKQQMILSSGEDSSANKTNYAQSAILPYSDTKPTKDNTFLSSPDTGFVMSSPYNQIYAQASKGRDELGLRHGTISNQKTPFQKPDLANPQILSQDPYRAR